MTTRHHEKSYEVFLEACAHLKSAEQFRQFFDLFLTPEERKDFTNRYYIVRELLLGEKTQREIAKDLQVSIAQITRGSNMLKVLSEDTKKLIKKVVV
jgi:TrpR family trp operon transcriptional repressor